MAAKKSAAELDILNARARVPDHVVYRPFPHETVVLNLRTGKYHGLDPVGARMFDALERASRVRDAAATIAAVYARSLDEIERDLSEFCRDLLERGLIELSGDGDG